MRGYFGVVEEWGIVKSVNVHGGGGDNGCVVEEERRDVSVGVDVGGEKARGGDELGFLFLHLLKLFVEEGIGCVMGRVVQIGVDLEGGMGWVGVGVYPCEV